MQFSGTVSIAASRDAVWAFLMDPNQVGQLRAGRGVDRGHRRRPLQGQGEGGIGFISARFVVDMTVAERTEPDLAILKAHGQAPGSAVDATADMPCPARPRARRRWTGRRTSRSPGTIASVGARLIEGTANKMIGQTFDCIRAKLEAG